MRRTISTSSISGIGLKQPRDRKGSGDQQPLIAWAAQAPGYAVDRLSMRRACGDGSLSRTRIPPQWHGWRASHNTPTALCQPSSSRVSAWRNNSHSLDDASPPAATEFHVRVPTIRRPPQQSWRYPRIVHDPPSTTRISCAPPRKDASGRQRTGGAECRDDDSQFGAVMSERFIAR